jgi:hypothetical protein
VHAISLRRAAAAAGALTAALGLSLAPAASATTTDPTCSAPTSQPFAPWLDYGNYQQVPGGSFESSTPSWTLSGAKVVSGNESFQVGGAADSRSLSLPAGAAATSPAFCGGFGYPTVRLFSSGGGLLGTLNVTVLYTDSTGVLRSQPLGVVTASGSWQPSLQLLTLSGLPLLTGSHLAVRLTAVGGGFSVDDVYVDPYGKR